VLDDRAGGGRGGGGGGGGGGGRPPAPPPPATGVAPRAIDVAELRRVLRDQGAFLHDVGGSSARSSEMLAAARSGQ
jgi:hypothetical protein